MSEIPLPNTLQGAVCAQYRRRGGRELGPYYFRFWREGGRLRKQYVRPDQVEHVRALCEASRTERARERSELAAARNALRETRAVIDLARKVVE